MGEWEGNDKMVNFTEEFGEAMTMEMTLHSRVKATPNFALNV